MKVLQFSFTFLERNMYPWYNCPVPCGPLSVNIKLLFERIHSIYARFTGAFAMRTEDVRSEVQK